MKKPPMVFIVDDRPAIVSSLESTVKTHCFLVECYGSAAKFIAEQDPSQVGCVMVDPLLVPQGDVVLRWLHESRSLLSVVLTTGLIAPSQSAPNATTSTPIVFRAHEISALLTMVTDGLAGSISRQVIRERSRG